jgi:c(7)-type cytochrome triheme protein
MYKSIFTGILLVATLALSATDAAAEYGDVVLNNYSDEAAVSPVVFPHWFHRIRYTCKTCHTDLNIKLSAGSNKIKMSDIMDGQYCGACHDGQVAWGIENCELCHSARQGIKTSIQRSQLQQLLQMDKHPVAPKKKR